ncbi:hypothetical protein E3N88_37974 [Mikania micrantha]|uniref:RING-type domain-containing protein n=1 Tax=Mikania micrantha TaxID=192012 RepID=A0A5N6LSM4_9ASTR|nr:hypothetical protein E3N88_37974 [Mikania micrantha]
MHSDQDDEHDLDCFLQLIDIVASNLESKLLRDKEHIFLITKMICLSDNHVTMSRPSRLADNDPLPSHGHMTIVSVNHALITWLWLINQTWVSVFLGIKNTDVRTYRTDPVQNLSLLTRELVAVGGTIGAVGGALIGFKNKMNFLQDIILGAVSGVVLSHKITRVTFDHFMHSDQDDEHDLDCFLQLIDIVASDLESKLLRDKEHIFLITKDPSCEKLIKLKKIEISNHNVFDSSGNAICCSICLQDFEVGNSAGIFPKCEHKFHQECISQWLHTRNSCPVCRTTV